MRSIFFFLLIGAQASAVAHPLDQAIQSLAKTRSEMNRATDAAKNDAWLQERTAQLNGKLAELWAEAILVPIQGSDAQMTALGYSFVKTGDAIGTYQFKKNENSAVLSGDIKNFNNERWKQLLGLAQTQADDLKAIAKMVESPQYSNGFSPREKNPVTSVVTGNRQQLLEEIKNISTNTIACIDYYNSAAQKYGLKMLINGEQVSWAPEELNRVHGAMATELLQSSEKAKVKSQVEELIKKAIEYRQVCITRAARTFLDSELKQLGETK